MRALVVVAAVAILTSAARADIAPDTFHGGTGLQLDPSQSKAAAQVEMKKERVTITLHSGPEGAFAVVDATFWMASPGPQRLKIAFPGQGVKVGDVFAVHPPLLGFHAFVDGKPVAVHADEKTHSEKSGPPGHEYSRTHKETWHGFAVAIAGTGPAAAPTPPTSIRVRYAVAAAGLRNVDDVNTHASVSYILHTGALWAKDIGEAVIEVKAADGVNLGGTSLRTMSMSTVSLVSLKGDGPPPPVQPASAVRSVDAITWTQTHLEPGAKDDIEIVFPSTTFDLGPSEALTARMLAATR